MFFSEGSVILIFISFRGLEGRAALVAIQLELQALLHQRRHYARYLSAQPRESFTMRELM